MSADKLETVEYDVVISLRFTEVADVEQLSAELNEIAGSIDWDTGDGNASWFSGYVHVSKPQVLS